jgi:hypothetical protein
MQALADYLSQMTTGAGAMRFFLQPLIAIVVGALMGRLDSHSGRGPYFHWVAARRQGEHPLLQGLKRVAVPLCLAVGLSLFFQYINVGSVRLLHALMAALFLVAVPYVLARDITSRIDGAWHRTHPRKLSH